MYLRQPQICPMCGAEINFIYDEVPETFPGLLFMGPGTGHYEDHVCPTNTVNESIAT